MIVQSTPRTSSRVNNVSVLKDQHYFHMFSRLLVYLYIQYMLLRA